MICSCLTLSPSIAKGNSNTGCCPSVTSLWQLVMHTQQHTHTGGYHDLQHVTCLHVLPILVPCVSTHNSTHTHTPQCHTSAASVETSNALAPHTQQLRTTAQRSTQQGVPAQRCGPTWREQSPQTP